VSKPDQSRVVVIGQVSGLFGVHGWVKVFSYTVPREEILDHLDWQLGDGDKWRPVRLAEGKRQGKTIVARLEGIGDRDVAAKLIGEQIAIERSQLPALEKGHYYWADLEGLRVETPDGVELGTVSKMMATGANDVMVVRGTLDGPERLIPFVFGDRILDVDFDAGVIQVDWDPDW
jgi:16S rRNA processing protein RimM